VDVQAAADVVLVRFRHEGREQSMFARHRLDRALQQHRVVAGAERVVEVMEIDLELARPVLRQHAVGRDLLDRAGLGDLGEEGVERQQFLRAVGRGVGRAPLLAARLHAAGQVNRAAGQQKLFGQGGFTGVRMRDDREGAAFFEVSRHDQYAGVPRLVWRSER